MNTERKNKKISVIIPIYNALEDLKLLLVLLNANFDFNIGEIFLINDCSDEETTKFLVEFSKENSHYKYVKNDENLGFVKTCNRGMELASGEIVVLLNSDTKVPSGFCERIIKCFESDSQIGIASPVSSCTCSYFIPQPKSMDLEDMNKLLQEKHTCTYPLIPAAEGFCYCIKKEVIEQQGYLDTVWGKGYHEEVDYAYKAITNGWKNVLIDDLYVYHKRQASFGSERRAELIRQNDPLFKERWEGFRENYTKENKLVNPVVAIEKEMFPKGNPARPKIGLKPIERIFSITNSEDKRHKVITLLGSKIKFKRNLLNNSKSQCPDFVKYIENGYQAEFIPYKDYRNEVPMVKPIAFYLPQFHSFKENAEWYGKGFSEWTNVTKAIPQYVGHYQPKLPYDVGFYNLNNNDIFYRQIELAKNYGIFGFSFYYYWFQGRKLMEKPIYNYLNDKNLDFPFCLCWACENWSKLWDGGNKELLVESNLEKGDSVQFWKDILPFLNDKRYIRINNKPVIIMYRPNIFDEDVLKSFITDLRTFAKDSDFKEIYLILAITNDIPASRKEINIEEWGFDACVEFPPHGFRNNMDNNKNVPIKNIKGYKNPKLNGIIYDMKKFLSNGHIIPLFENTNIYRGIFPHWDNSARKAQSVCLIFEGMTPDLYKKWLMDIVQWTRKNKKESEQYIFINAWNEWAEGAYLEPDMKHGYAYLDATREVLNEYFCKK